MYHRQIDKLADINKSHQWLEKTGLKDSTEGLIVAAQKQTLSTRARETGVYPFQALNEGWVKMPLRQSNTSKQYYPVSQSINRMP